MGFEHPSMASKPSIQPHIIYDSRTTVQATSDGASDITLDAQLDVQSA